MAGSHAAARCLPLAALFLTLAGAVMPPRVAQAGGGPENVFLVVNSASWASLAVANQYIRLRQIPPGNVLYLAWDEGTDSVPVEKFRQKILGPILVGIDHRGLSDQIDYVVYSSDFPFAVDLSGDLGGVQLPRQFDPTCSINAATYFFQMIMTKDMHLIGLRTNQYMRAAEGRRTDEATRGFHGWYGWGPNGQIMDSGGQHYLLSTVLAVTSGRGNSLTEAINYLNRSAAADGTRPKGTVYYAKHGDVRSTTRSGGFADAVAELKRLGVAAEIVAGEVPSGKADVQGAMLGSASFSWQSSQSTIRPGAICEHLTSTGGVLNESGGQTPLTELLRYGAAGASGAVTEPYALQDKFPVPAIQVHYARGCSLAEAFYQSVFGPYQLIIVGDPLCRPWANIPAVQVDGLKANQSVSGTLSLKPSARPAAAKTDKKSSGDSKDSPIDHFELFVDGRRTAQCRPEESIDLDTTALADGYHDFRIVAIESGPIESQGRLLVPVTVDNHGLSAELTLSSDHSVRSDQSLTAQIKSTGLPGIIVTANGRIAGRLAAEEGEVKLSPRQFGAGPVTLQAVGLGHGASGQNVGSKPILLQVKPPKALPGLKEPKGSSLTHGLQLKLAGGATATVEETQAYEWLTSAGVKPRENYSLDGYFDIEAEDVYQFQVRCFGDLKLVVDSSTLCDVREGQYTEQFLPVALGAGMHHLKITGKAGDPARLRVLFGGKGTWSLNGNTFRHLN